MNSLLKIRGRLFQNLGIYLVLIFIIESCGKESTKTLHEKLLPSPQKIELKDGLSINPKKIKAIYLFSKADENDRFAANLLIEEINQIFKFKQKLEIIQSYEDLTHPAIILGIPSEDQGFSDFCSGLPSPRKDNEESYVLDINGKSIIISGGGKAGLFYGVQTLIQLLEEAKWEKGSLQGLLIEDWPKVKLRAVHYNFFFHLDRYEYIKESVKKLAKYKVNGMVM